MDKKNNLIAGNATWDSEIIANNYENISSELKIIAKSIPNSMIFTNYQGAGKMAKRIISIN